jgi:hypothetical protein
MDSPDFSYHDLKAALYIGLTLFGSSLLFIALYLKRTAPVAVDPSLNFIPAIILFMVGMTCIFFGVQVFIIRDDPEIWQ